MKICYITIQFPAPSETFASLDATTLRDLGHEVYVLAMRPRHQAYKKMVLERNLENMFIEHFSLRKIFSTIQITLSQPVLVLSLILWIIICNKKNIVHLVKSFILLPSALHIFKKIQEIKPDVVHLFWGHYPSMVGFLVKKKMPDIVVSMFLGAYDLEQHYSGSIWLAKRTNLLFTHAKANLVEFEKIGIHPKSVHVIHRGTSLNHNITAKENKFDTLDKPVLITASRLIPIKFVNDVLMIFSHILKHYPKATLLIMGDGPDRKRLNHVACNLKIDHAVKFLGHVSQDTLIEKLSVAHFFILMSQHKGERLPNVVKEAMYQKCLCITTNTKGIDELVTNGVNGFIVNQGDCTSATSLILEHIQNKKRCIQMTSYARKKIEEHFDVQVSIKKQVSLWKASISSVKSVS